MPQGSSRARCMPALLRNSGPRCRPPLQADEPQVMNASVIELSGISKRYLLGDTEVQALKGVELAVPRGAFVAVRGPSGSGKSTLLNICGLIDGFDAGSYRLEDQDVGGLDEIARTLIRRSRIGFVFQTYNLVPVMTVRENVEYPLLLAGIEDQERNRRVDEILQQVGLADRAGHRPDLLSGGQRQRTAIARAGQGAGPGDCRRTHRQSGHRHGKPGHRSDARTGPPAWRHLPHRHP